MKRVIFVLLTVVAASSRPVLAAGQTRQGMTTVLQGDAFTERADLRVDAKADLDSTLAELAVDHGLLADSQTIHRADNTDVLVIPLHSAARDDRDSLALLYDATRNDRYFLLLHEDPVTGGTVHLWGDGPTEIIIDAQGIYCSAHPGEATFRLRDRSQTRIQSTVAASGLTDNIQCLASLLGLTVNPESLTSALSSVACQTLKGADDFRRAVADLLLIAGHCFSAVNCAGLCPVSTTFCLTGLAKWITCGIAECSSAAPVPAVPSLFSPANGASVSGAAVTLYINAVSGATKYNTQVSTDSTFPAGSTTTSADHGTSATWTGFLSDGRRFYWRARAGNTSGWSQWSSSSYFVNGSVTPSVPAPPTLSSPADGSRVPGANVTLYWNPSAGATKYQTQVSTNASFSSPISGNEQSGISTTWQGFSNNGARWYWRVRAGNDKGWSQWSAVRSFLNY